MASPLFNSPTELFCFPEEMRRLPFFRPRSSLHASLVAGLTLFAALTLAASGKPKPGTPEYINNTPWTDEQIVRITLNGDLEENRREIPKHRVQADKAVRYAAFPSRVGTLGVQDDPRWWNFDRNDRAQVADAFYTIYKEIYAKTPTWTGSVAELEAGDNDQAFRETIRTWLCFSRYLVNGETYATYPDIDPTFAPMTMAAAMSLWAGTVLTRPNPYWGHEIPTTNPGYSELARQGASVSSLGIFDQLVDGFQGFLHDTGQAPRHRFFMLNPGSFRFNTGSAFGEWVALSGGDERWHYWGTNVLWVAINNDAEVVHRDPIKSAVWYPWPGYVPAPLMDCFISDEGFRIPFSVTFADKNGVWLGGAHKEVTATVKRKGEVIYSGPVGYTYDAGLANLWWFADLSRATAEPEAFTEGKFGEDVDFEVTLDGLRWEAYFTVNGQRGEARTSPYYEGDDYWVDPAALTPRSLSYRFTLFDPSTVKKVYPSTKTVLSGLSGRASIGTGNRIEVLGFQVTGTEPLRVALRGQGPSLSAYGLKNPASATQLRLYQILSDGTNPKFGENSNWKAAQNWRLIESVHLAPGTEQEAALVATLRPGTYTAEIRDPNDKGGVGIAEIYSIDTVSQSQLSGLSCRAVVDRGEAALVTGFQLSEARTVLVRTQGPSLVKHGISDAVKGTRLKLERVGASVPLAEVSTWRLNDFQNARFLGDLAYAAPAFENEAALVLTLPPGAYTATVEPSEGVPGVGILEIYEVPSL